MRAIARWLAAGTLMAAPLVFLPTIAAADVVEGGTLTVPAKSVSVKSRTLKQECAPAKTKAAPRVGRVLLANDNGVRPA